MKTGYKVCDVMTLKPVSVDHKTFLHECARIMAENHVGSLLVRKGSKLGIVTEQDIVRKAVAKGNHPKKTTVGEIAEWKLFTVSPEKDIYDALILMREKNIRHVPVMSRNKMVGFLTAKDILKVNPSLFDLLAEKIELKEEERKPLYGSSEGICQECEKFSFNLSRINGVLMCEKCQKR